MANPVYWRCSNTLGVRCPPDPNPEINEHEYPDAIPDP